jgi:hypothetical protein
VFAAQFIVKRDSPVAQAVPEVAAAVPEVAAAAP